MQLIISNSKYPLKVKFGQDSFTLFDELRGMSYMFIQVYIFVVSMYSHFKGTCLISTIIQLFLNDRSSS